MVPANDMRPRTSNPLKPAFVAQLVGERAFYDRRCQALKYFSLAHRQIVAHPAFGSSGAGILRPRALATSYSTGACTGRSAGCVEVIVL